MASRGTYSGGCSQRLPGETNVGSLVTFSGVQKEKEGVPRGLTRKLAGLSSGLKSETATGPRLVGACAVCIDVMFVLFVTIDVCATHGNRGDLSLSCQEFAVEFG